MKEHGRAKSIEDASRELCCGYLALAEVGVYVLLGVLLCAVAGVGVAGAVDLLWLSVRDWTGTKALFELIDRLLFVLMLVEILHTVRISIKSHMLVVEPFLIVGLIATIRRMLVLTLQAEQFTAGRSAGMAPTLFRATMIELGILGGLVAILVVSIYFMRMTRPKEAAETLRGEVPESY